MTIHHRQYWGDLYLLAEMLWGEIMINKVTKGPDTRTLNLQMHLENKCMVKAELRRGRKRNIWREHCALELELSLYFLVI